MNCRSFFITREDFESAVAQFPSICDQWSIKAVTLRGDNKETFYLSQQVQRPSVLSRETDTTVVDSSEEEGVHLENNDAVALDVPNVQLICYHYTIVYSESYQVPVIYFTASWQDGRQLHLHEVWEQIPSTSDIVDKLSTLTQTEHPILGIPCYHVHPCNSAVMMSSVLEDARQDDDNVKWQTRYLIMWLSLISPLVNLPFSASLFRISAVKNTSTL